MGEIWKVNFEQGRWGLKWLKLRNQHVLDLYLNGTTTRELAELCDIAIGTVRQNLGKAALDRIVTQQRGRKKR